MGRRNISIACMSEFKKSTVYAHVTDLKNEISIFADSWGFKIIREGRKFVCNRSGFTRKNNHVESTKKRKTVNWMKCGCKFAIHFTYEKYIKQGVIRSDHSIRISNVYPDHTSDCLVTSVSSFSASTTSTTTDTTNVPYSAISLVNSSLLSIHSSFHSKNNLGSFNVYNPASTLDDLDNGSAVIAKVKRMDEEDTKDAIDRSALALTSWRDNTTGMHRSQILNQWSQLIKDNSDDIAKVMTLESGKPLMESFGEINYATSSIDLYSAEAIRPTSSGGGAIWPSPFVAADCRSPRGKIITVKEAVGVTAMITPWNFPISMITRKVAPALAAGCTVVLKPSELTPLTAIILRNLAEKAGVPRYVFQLITADREAAPKVGSEFCRNEIVKKISFTGSTTVGKHLMKLSSSTIKRLSLELGGNAPFIVFEDADIDQAINSAVSSKFRNAGQTCVCADRFLIHSSVATRFVTGLCDKIKEIKVGPGIDVTSTMGPLISKSAVDKVAEKVAEAISEGGECIIGGEPLSIGPNYFAPTVIQNVNIESKLWSDETFGPIAAIRTFETEEEAISLANNSTTGLASYIFTQNVSTIFRVAARLQTGMVGINDGVISTASAPFGGIKESGLGREGSDAGLAEYLETKYIFLNY